jgi:polysaccharide biosynthesis transport protein
MENQNVTRFQNPLSYLKLFFRRKWLLLTPLFFGFTLGVVAFFTVSPNYESYATILVEEQKTMNPLIQDLAVSTNVVQRLQAIKESILGWNNISEMIKKLNLAPRAVSESQFESLVKEIKKKIGVQMSSGNIIRLSFQSQNPQEAFLVANTLTDSFISANLKTQTKETNSAIEFIKEQLQVYKRKIKESEVNNLEEQLKRLLADSTEQHPMVRDLRSKLDSAKRELESGEYKVEDVKSNDPVRQALKQELDKISGGEQAGMAAVPGVEDTAAPGNNIYKLIVMDKLDSAQARDISVNQKIYDMLLQRLETAKITQRLEASKQGTRYTILDPARLPLKPKKPQMIWVLLGLFLGVGAGVSLVFGREFLDQSFLDLEDAKRALDLPILGGISKITTQEEIARAKQRKIGLITLVTFSGLGLIIASALFSLLKK